jgi:hypothetical protein
MKGSGDPAGAVIRQLPFPLTATGPFGSPLPAGMAPLAGGSSLLGENGFQWSPDACAAAMLLPLAAGTGLPAPLPVLPPCCCIHESKQYSCGLLRTPRHSDHIFHRGSVTCGSISHACKQTLCCLRSPAVPPPQGCRILHNSAAAQTTAQLAQRRTRDWRRVWPRSVNSDVAACRPIRCAKHPQPHLASLWAAVQPWDAQQPEFKSTMSLARALPQQAQLCRLLATVRSKSTQCCGPRNCSPASCSCSRWAYSVGPVLRQLAGRGRNELIRVSRASAREAAQRRLAQARHIVVCLACG